MKPSIEINALSKQYGAKLAVDAVSFNVNEGELFALLGMNGAGKTTLINMLSCVTKPTSGDALLLGKSIVTQSDIVKNAIAVSPQETAIAPNLTVRENLELMAGLYGFDKQMLKQKVDRMIERFSLQPYEKQKSKTMSGGWKRKLSIAMALISDPKILFLDEIRCNCKKRAMGGHREAERKHDDYINDPLFRGSRKFIKSDMYYERWTD